jgi:tRNA threonylcarbamoyladenosine biosynthesis protein TsaB
MNILAIETTEKFGSVALLQGGGNADTTILAEIVLPKDRRSSQTLHPALHTLFETTHTAPKEVDVVAVVAGPGSFTGLRVGVTAAKVFAYSVGAKVIALDTFQTVASGVPNNVPVSVGVDAQRGEVVAAVLRQTAEGRVEMIREPALMPLVEWWRHAELHDDVLFTGPALEKWCTKAPPHLTLAEESFWFPKASLAGKLVAEQLVSGYFDDVWSLLPIYSRLSAAEEKRKAML